MCTCALGPAWAGTRACARSHGQVHPALHSCTGASLSLGRGPCVCPFPRASASSVAQLHRGQLELGQGPVRVPVPTAKCIILFACESCLLIIIWTCRSPYSAAHKMSTIHVFRANHSVRAPAFIPTSSHECASYLYSFFSVYHRTINLRSTRASLLTALSLTLFSLFLSLAAQTYQNQNCSLHEI